MSELLFRFGIITDTHVRAPGGDRSSPFPVNEKANSRAEYAIGMLANYQPSFAVHLGDMVHPLPHMSVYNESCIEAHRIFKPLADSLHFVAGNHDVGDKPMPASPASSVGADALAIYRSQFGDSWYRFDHGPISLVVINSSLVNTGETAEAEQRQWLENELVELSEKTTQRIFLFSHYPPYIHDLDEPEHYDNYAQPGRQWLLDLIERHSIEAVFSGHVHHFFRNYQCDTDLYCLPATSFVRQDYAELFRVSAAAEHGRDDDGKYHVALVDVTTEGHKLHLLPTFGHEKDHELEAPDMPSNKQATVCLRHAWHESVSLPYNGPMEEFSRKRVRNDYTLMRLLQLGLHDVRVPLDDLQDSEKSYCVSLYYRAGIRFHAAVLDLQLANLKHHRAPTHMESIEVVLARYPQSGTALLENLQAVDVAIAALPQVPLWVGAARSSSQAVTTGGTGEPVFAHSVTSGFLPEHCEELADALLSSQLPVVNQRLAGMVVQVPFDTELLPVFEQVQSVTQAVGDGAGKSAFRIQLLVRFGPENPALQNFDDSAIAKRVEEALTLAKGYPNVTLLFDTLMDIDRGYAPRNGLIDRRANFRQAGLQLCGF